MINIEQALELKYPSLSKYPQLLKDTIFGVLKKLIHQNDINEFINTHKSDGAFEFIEAVLDYFSFSYTISNKQKLNIPASGRAIIVANHPLGALDALSLIDLIKSVRSDIKVVANDLLMYISALNPILIGVDNLSQNTTKESIKQIYEALKEEKIVIIFPSGEVSRARPTGIKDIKWNKGFLHFAKKAQAPILPIYIKATNSKSFYTISAINKKLSSLFLPHEMFKKKNGSISFKVGELIPLKSFSKMQLEEKTLVNLFKKHLYAIAKDKKGIFNTQKCIAHPESRQDIKEELKHSSLLGETTDKKQIYLFNYQKGSIVLKEIGRLREFTFRKVDEGTGAKRDTDNFDRYYKHIVLWDDDNLEIVGSYRIGESDFIYRKYGKEGFYSNSLFAFNNEFLPYLSNSIELGRSFVQPKYWGSRALDYLWQGIGAYLHKNPNIRYMFGPVSISDMYPKVAKNFLVYYYNHYYGTDTSPISAKTPYTIETNEIKELIEIFADKDEKSGFLALKESLSYFNLSVPTLYKQYVELCEEGGIKFLDFNIDKDFGNCLDSFILVDISKIKPLKAKRYIK